MAQPDTPAPRPAPQAERAWMLGDARIHATHVALGEPAPIIAEQGIPTVAGWWLPDGAPLPPDVVARALAQHEAEVKAAQWEHYKLGILHAAEFVQGAHRDHVVAAEIITHLLSGESLRSLKEQAKRAEVSFSWAEVERQCGLVRDRATPRPAPDGEVGP